MRRGDRTLLMVKPGLPLIAAAFGLFQLGAVPVIIDPGMGLRNFLTCVARTRPRALVGIPLAQVVSRILRPALRLGHRARARPEFPDRAPPVRRRRGIGGRQRSRRPGGDPLHLGLDRRPEGRPL